MFTYKEMSDVIAPQDGRTVKDASLTTRFRNFKAKGLINPIPREQGEDLGERNLEEHTFDTTEFCKARILSTLTDFGCDIKILSKVVNAMEYRDVINITPLPGVPRRIPTELEQAMNVVQAGKPCDMWVAIVGTEISVHMPWKHEPTGPHITLPLTAMLGPILSLAVVSES